MRRVAEPEDAPHVAEKGRGEGSRDPLRESFALPRASLFRFFSPSLYEPLYIFTVRRGKGVLPHFLAVFFFF